MAILSTVDVERTELLTFGLPMSSSSEHLLEAVVR